ncbi:hypothetical protein ACPPVT_15960 [Angustibacter sp. McL0619]|uniref:hypothetical protein n=1 Tax=Angustibacter sp. McL0619 TaxID=3415676 RepID=UPI003CEF34FF
MGDKTIKNWEKDLPGLTDEGVRERLMMARKFERWSMDRGMGRNPKAGRMWREKIQQAEAELERRGLSSQDAEDRLPTRH